MGSKYAVNTNHLFLQLPERTLGVYNCWDSYNTARLVHPLLSELKLRGNLQYATEIMEPLQTAVINMQARGLLLDKDALRTYTILAAKCLFMEDNIGSIEPGKHADMVVWSEDLYNIPTEQLKDVKVEMTFVEGQQRYQNS